MGSHKRILSRGVTLFKLYFRIRLLSVEREQTVCGGLGVGERKQKSQWKGYCKSPGSDERGSDQGGKRGSGGGVLF